MKLIEIEPHFWELYQDEFGMYLNVLIHNNFVTYEKSICLDVEASQDFLNQGKLSIDALARRIESSMLRKDYDRFYTYENVSIEQKQSMHDAFIEWKNMNQI